MKKFFACILFSVLLMSSLMAVSAETAVTETYDGFYINEDFSGYGVQTPLNFDPGKSAILPWAIYTGHGNQDHGIRQDENGRWCFYVSVNHSTASYRHQTLRINKNGLPNVNYQKTKMVEMDFKFENLPDTGVIYVWSRLVLIKKDENGTPCLYLTNKNGAHEKVVTLDTSEISFKMLYSASSNSDRYVKKIWMNGSVAAEYEGNGFLLYSHGGYPVEMVYGASGTYDICSINCTETDAITQVPSLSVYRIAYYGLGNVDVLSTSLEGGSNRIAFPRNGMLTVRFNNPMDTETLTPENIQLLDNEGNPVSYEESVPSERDYVLNFSKAPLESNGTYTLSISNAVKNILGEGLAETIMETFYVAQAEEAAVTEITDEGDYLNVTVCNMGEAAAEIPLYVFGYQNKSTGRLSVSNELLSQRIDGGSEAVYRVEKTVSAEGYAFFLWDNNQVVKGKSVYFEKGNMTAGDPIISESTAAATGTGITLDAPQVDVDNGGVSLLGYYHDLPNRPVSVIIKDPNETKIVALAQCMTDENGAFQLSFTLPQGTTAGTYIFSARAGTMNAAQPIGLPIDFANAKPTLDNLTVAASAFVGEQARADYNYVHMGNISEGSSEFIWEISDSADSGFTILTGETGKTIALDESYLFHYIRCTVKPKTKDGIAGEPKTSAPCRVLAKPEVSNVYIKEENGVLVANYTYRHLADYEEQGHLFCWLVSSSADGSYTEIEGETLARYVPKKTDSGKNFKVIIIPGANVPMGEETARYGAAVTSSVYAYARAASASDKPSVSKNTASRKGGGVLISTAPAETITPAETQEKDFSDVSKEYWAREDIIYLYDLGMISGVSADSFEPERAVTRAEFVKILVKLLELETVETTKSFLDVTDEAWYAPFVQTAVAHGLIDGADGFFMPDKKLSREEMAKILVNAYEWYRGEILVKENSFTDRDSFSSWAENYIDKAVSAGLMRGMEDGYFSASGVATRAQAVTVFAKFHKNMKSGGENK